LSSCSIACTILSMVLGCQHEGVRGKVARQARVRRLPPQERREQIVRAVLDVVAEYGVPEATIARIARAADVSEGTLYVYFSSRKDMLLAALESILREMYDLIDSTGGQDALARLRNIEAAHSEQMRAERGLMAYPWFEFIAAGPQVGIRDAVAATHRAAYQHLKKIIDDGKAKGTIRADVDTDRLAWGFYTVLWAENIACMIGLREYLDDGHSAHILGLVLRDAAAR
jgi:TetR/AcrR family fatty acid metabolism transcriptional regulator